MKLFHFPRACSRVTMTALEEAGFEYEDQVVNIMKGEQKNPEYLAVHRSGKVPALQVGTEVITENASIIYYLHTQKPEAGILPAVASGVERAQQVSDLAWCSGTVHPTMRQIRMPIRFTDGDPSGIQQKGHEMLAGIAAHVDDRLGQGEWWYGESWSILDVYLNWIFTMAGTAEFDLSPYGHLTAMMKNAQQRDSFQRALAREASAAERAGLPTP